MATIGDWTRYRLLRDLIAEAIDEAWADEGYEDCDAPEAFNVVISPDLQSVYATTEPWWDDERLNMALSENWFFESATSYEDALNIADKYFDLR